MRKAYVVSHDWCDASVIAFAEKPSQAKAIAKCSDFLCDYEYIELQCRRLKEADFFAKTTNIRLVEGSTIEEQRIMREIGWYEIDHTSEECSECGLHEWEELPESQLTEIDGRMVCQECRESP